MQCIEQARIRVFSHPYFTIQGQNRRFLNIGQWKPVFLHILLSNKCNVLVFYKKNWKKLTGFFIHIFHLFFIVQKYWNGCSEHFRKRNWLPRRSLATNKITYSNCDNFLITAWHQRVYVEQFIFWMKHTLRAVLFASANMKNFINIDFRELMVQ